MTPILEVVEELQRLINVEIGTSVIQVKTGSEQQSVPLRELQQIYIKKSILVHPEKNGSDVLKLATICMQNLARSYEL